MASVPVPAQTALQSLINGSLSGKREQTVLTPRLILDPLWEVWGTIKLDPCAPGADKVWVPCARCKGTGTHKGKPCRFSEPPHGGWYAQTVRAEREYCLPQDGADLPWTDRTYCNPPYDKLQRWLQPFCSPEDRIAWLVPVRPHRSWWRAWARSCDAVVYLDPFAFEGHIDKFPAPLCLGYRGSDADAIVRAYAGLGGVV